MKHSFCEDWEFTHHWTEAFGKGLPVPKQQAVRLPHTCREVPLHYASPADYEMVCGYRKRFRVPPVQAAPRLFLRFDGAAHQAVVRVNGRVAGQHRGGYTGFAVEITDLVDREGENLLTVQLDTREDPAIPPFGFVIDYLTYGGLYREVWLEATAESRLTDLFVYTPTLHDAVVQWTAELAPAAVAVRIRLETADGTLLAQQTAQAAETGKMQLSVPDAQPWDTEHPVLHHATAELLNATGQPIDRKQVTFGFRTAEFRADGFYLNGKKTFLRGLNRHQSYAYQGYAMPDSIQQLDAQLLKKQLGCNAVRTSHYPQSPAFLDACDELGLLVFVEMPGWQHIGDEAWQAQALQNCREMVCQCRNHPSVFLWGVRVNGSSDNEAFYKRTNEAVHRLDPTRPTGGVRIARKSQLLEDVYAYNDYSYSGRGPGCEPRSAVTPDLRKGYLISEFGGQQFPAKAFDDEPHRLAQALRHAAVLNDAIAQQGVAGALGWCMADYNTHREFGSGDRICYHGVTDLFRNPKLSAAVYASQKTPRSPSDVVFEVSSSMALGDHPGGFAGACWVFTNAESVRLYRGNDYIAEFTPDRHGRFAAMTHPPIEINDFVGSLLEKYEGMDSPSAQAAAAILNDMRRCAMELSPLSKARMLSLRLSWNELLRMYYKYIGVLGSSAPVYRFEAVWHGRAVRTVVREPVQSVRLECTVHNPLLTDGPTWDCAAVSLRAIDQNGNLLPYCGEAVQLSVEGPVKILGPSIVPLRGGMAGTYLATTGKAGRAVLHCRMEGALDTEAVLTVRSREEQNV